MLCKEFQTVLVDISCLWPFNYTTNNAKISKRVKSFLNYFLKFLNLFCI